MIGSTSAIRPLRKHNFRHPDVADKLLDKIIESGASPAGARDISIGESEKWYTFRGINYNGESYAVEWNKAPFYPVNDSLYRMETQENWNRLDLGRWRIPDMPLVYSTLAAAYQLSQHPEESQRTRAGHFIEKFRERLNNQQMMTSSYVVYAGDVAHGAGELDVVYHPSQRIITSLLRLKDDDIQAFEAVTGTTDAELWAKVMRWALGEPNILTGSTKTGRIPMLLDKIGLQCIIDMTKKDAEGFAIGVKVYPEEAIGTLPKKNFRSPGDVEAELDDYFGK